ISSELKEIRLPYRESPRPTGGARDTLARAEQQIDQLIEMLAAEHATEQRSGQAAGRTAYETTRQIAGRATPRLAPRRRTAEYRPEEIEQPAASRSAAAQALQNDAVPAGTADAPTAQALELSIVMPCLDEADTVGNCVLKALYAIEKM